MLNRTVIALVVFYISSFLFFTFRITDVPPGINGDEAVIGYNAALVARTGRDSEGRFLPLFTKVDDSTDWKQPVTFYSEVLAFRLFKPSYFNLRTVSVVFILISGTLIFCLIKELLGFKSAVLGLLIFSTTPILMIQSHLALENIAPVPFIALWLWMLAKYTKKQELNYLILAAASLGIGLYSYLGLRLIVPVFAVTSVVYIYYITSKKNALKRILVFIATLLPFFMLLLLIKNQYPGAILGQYRPYNINTYQQLFLPYISSFDPSFLFINGDITPYHSTGKHGVFLLATLPLFILGIIKIIQKNNPMLSFILGVFFLSPVLFGLGSDIHRGSRLLVLIPSYVVTATLGLKALFDLNNGLRRFILSVVAILLIVLNYTDFLSDYWYKYPTRVKSQFAKPMHLGFAKASQLAKQEHLKVYIEDSFSFENEIATKFFEQVYFPDGLDKLKAGEKLPVGSALIAGSASLSDQQKNRLQRYEVGSEFFSVFVSK